MLINEIISILVNSLTFIIFTSFQDIESIPKYRGTKAISQSNLIQITTFERFLTASSMGAFQLQ